MHTQRHTPAEGVTSQVTASALPTSSIADGEQGKGGTVSSSMRWHRRGEGGHLPSSAGSEVNDAELGDEDHQQGQRKPTEHKAAQKRRLVSFRELVCGTNLMITQLRYKHKKPHRTHTPRQLLPSAEPLVVAPLSSMVSGLAHPHWGPEANNPTGLAHISSLGTVHSYLPVPCQQSHFGHSTSVHRSYETHLP